MFYPWWWVEAGQWHGVEPNPEPRRGPYAWPRIAGWGAGEGPFPDGFDLFIPLASWAQSAKGPFRPVEHVFSTQWECVVRSRVRGVLSAGRSPSSRLMRALRMGFSLGVGRVRALTSVGATSRGLGWRRIASGAGVRSWRRLTAKCFARRLVGFACGWARTESSSANLRVGRMCPGDSRSRVCGAVRRL